MTQSLIVGYGYTGRALASVLRAQRQELIAVQRTARPALDHVPTLVADLALGPISSSMLPSSIGTVYYLVSAAERTEAAYRTAYIGAYNNLLRGLGGGVSVRRHVFVSSTAVYGDLNGAWCDEETSAAGSDVFACILREGERICFEHGGVVVRLGGIYGPTRARLLNQLRDGALTLPATGDVFTNRIHRDDAARCLAHIAALDTPAEIYLGVDCDPVSYSALCDELADSLHVPRPTRSADVTLPRRGSKRCRNTRLLASGFTFTHPTFREGYAALLR